MKVGGGSMSLSQLLCGSILVRSVVVELLRYQFHLYKIFTSSHGSFYNGQALALEQGMNRP